MVNTKIYDGAPQSIRDFIYYEQIVKGRSELTVKNYFNDLRTFFRFYKIRKKGAPEGDFSKIDISDITDNDIKSVDLTLAQEFLVYMKTQKKTTPRPCTASSPNNARKKPPLRMFGAAVLLCVRSCIW